jgi:P-type E1-E2 ATPase
MEFMFFIFLSLFKVPKDFHSILSNYTKEGYRVIAIARKELDLKDTNVQRIERENIEKDLEFLGLIVMENRLKPESKPTIDRLKAANIRTIMCTGDNLLTALSVARDCGLISEKSKIIIVDAEPGLQPKFSYADIAKQRVKQIEFSKVRKIF